ncbi:hypothetical protein JTB14_000901 [Gonioctena quinquepunctata]|nr:hypothetical protein JTB14_000901 [Gonioctena quinquepunctata]
MENYFWTSGPTWMRLPVADWPIREQRFFDESGEEVDSIKCLVSTEETETHPLYDMVMRLSSYTTILRVTVWVLRFVKILTVKSFITLSDMNRAEVALVRIVQGKYFKSDIKLLNLGKEISNRLRKLNPFLQNGILMVGGRLENAPLTFVARHPIILPDKIEQTNSGLRKAIMRYASSNLNSAKVLWATLLACCLQACLIVVAADDSTNSRSEDDNLQVNDILSKRDWNKDLNIWGKRGWNSIHGGWALKRSIPSWVDEHTFQSAPIVQKRSWKNFQEGWGKRAPYDEEAAMQEISSMLRQQNNQDVPIDTEEDFVVHDNEKRNWSKFTDGWGKRSKWDNFRGTWGKREPACDRSNKSK